MTNEALDRLRDARLNRPKLVWGGDPKAPVVYVQHVVEIKYSPLVWATKAGTC